MERMEFVAMEFIPLNGTNDNIAMEFIPLNGTNGICSNRIYSVVRERSV